MHFIKFYYIQQDSNAKLELALNLLAEQREHNRKQDERMQQLENEIRQLRDERQGTAVKSINGQPESCEDLKALGHSLNGFYSVRSNNALHSVFCDFSKSTGDSGKKIHVLVHVDKERIFECSSTGFQLQVGSMDVKSPVYFYAQRATDYYGDGYPIPFELARLNVGEAMNISSGIFTVPRDGIYFFSFNGLKSASAIPIYLNLMVNGFIAGSSFTGATEDYFTVSLSSTLHLTNGDQVYLKLNNVGILDESASAGPYTHFSGMLLQEDLSF